ncbi:flagellar hook capping FlgD N-terminal domain-containing protein [Ferrimicrobium acidiphilum]|uniref:flagellar hook capping FlgD N-terminal domain-containing protein n=1 Tax=Ferrimicrobium acidiphilum TaxID=121039 RepID=UPI0023EF6438|nr:flagellar hook capping FlgD N-terminal domain-containing protein [Ferrimicrobium acidiphilum]
MTMPISSVAAGAAAASTGSTSSSTAQNNSIASLSSNEFLKLLVTELTNQNPLSPMNPSSMVQQTSSLSMVQLLDSVSNELSSIRSQAGVVNAANLIGQTVSYTTASGKQGSGVVSGVAMANGSLNLNINGLAIPSSEVTAVGKTIGGAGS